MSSYIAFTPKSKITKIFPHLFSPIPLFIVVVAKHLKTIPRFHSISLPHIK